MDVILTSFCRWDLLEKTLESFFEFNTYPLSKFIIHEDKGLDNFSQEDWDRWIKIQRKYPDIKWVVPNKRRGQILALDELLSHVETEFYFTLEDDWEFYKPGFIEKSISILKQHDKIIQVWLREHNDTNGHPLEIDGSLGLETFKINHNGLWSGFSFNPSVRRLYDYKRIGSYSQYTTFIPERPYESEVVINRLYRDLGYKATILPEGYVKHNGWDFAIRN